MAELSLCEGALLTSDITLVCIVVTEVTFLLVANHHLFDTT